MAESQLSLLFRLKADSSEARKELKDFKSDVDKETKELAGIKSFENLAKSIGLSSTQTAALTTALPLAGAAIAAVASAATGAAIALFTVAKNMSDAGDRFVDLSEKSGLSVETLSALNLAAEQAGSSVEDLAQGVVLFSKTIAAANQGNEEAREKLIRLGLDPQEAFNDLEGSLRKAFETIANAEGKINKTALATDAFGKSGANLKGIIDASQGSIDNLIKQAEELGVLFTEKDAKAADEFSDTLAVLKLQAQGAANTFAKEFAPDITSAMKSISESLKENRDTIKAWGSAVSTAIDLASKWYSVMMALRVPLEAIGVPTLPGEVGKASRALATPQTAIPAMPDAGPKILSESDDDEFSKAAKDAAKRVAQSGMGVLEAELKAASERRDTLLKALTDSVKTGAKTEAEAWREYVQAQSNSLELERILAEERLKLKEADAKSTEEVLNLRRTAAIEEAALETKAAQDRSNAYSTFLEARRDFGEKQKSEGEKQIKDLDDYFKQLTSTSESNYAENLTVAEEYFSQGLLPITEKGFKKWLNVSVAQIESIFGQRKTLLMAKLRDELATFASGQIRKDLFNMDPLKQEGEIYAIAQQRLKDLIKQKEAFKSRGKEVPKEDLEEEAVLVKALNAIELLRLQQNKAIADEIKKQKEDLERMAEDIPEPGETSDGNILTDEQIGRAPKNINDLDEFDQTLKDRFSGLTDVVTQMKFMALDAFQAMADGFGAMVESWVLYGNVGEGGLRKMAASVLANVARVAATYAIMSLAAAALATTAWGAALLGGTPASFLKAAALFGAVAAVAAVAGRAVAGSAFQSASTQAASGGGSSGGNSASSAPQTFTQNPENTGGGAMRPEYIFADTINSLVDTLRGFQAVSPGSVLIAGAKEQRGFIAQTYNDELGSDAGLINDLGGKLRLS